MTLPTEALVEAIGTHSRGFADAARGHLDATVEHCPGWSVADLVNHLTEVHWFWGSIVAELLDAPPEETRRPQRVPDDELIDTFVAGAHRAVRVFEEADQSAACWTWAGWKQDVGFVTRHQVQEAAVHHWDVAHAAGEPFAMDETTAADAVEEFLHFSLASEDDPDDPVKPPLEGTFALQATDTGDAWTLTDGDRPGTVRVSSGADAGVPVVAAPAVELLLWCYGRIELDGGEVDPARLSRFHEMCFLD